MNYYKLNPLASYLEDIHFFFSCFVIVIVTVRMQMQFNHENQILRNEPYILLETKGLNNEREKIFNGTNNEILDVWRPEISFPKQYLPLLELPKGYYKLVHKIQLSILGYK